MASVRIRIIGEDKIVVAALERELNSCAALEIVSRQPSDVILADFGVGGDPDFDLIESEGFSAGCPVLALVSGFPEAEKILYHSWSVELAGVLRRTVETEVLEAAVMAVMNDIFIIDPSFRSGLFPERGRYEDAVLSPREKEVLGLLADGLPNKTIAYRLSISENTVKFHINSLMTKLDSRSRTDVVVNAMKRGLLHL